ncbi:MAG: GntR family transcriptional regulator [Rhodoglobus sp.]|nr:GntR family transcriptional regulator [Rhodoglobus sp.]
MSDEAYARLQDAIISGELPPGERLRDYDLAERLGTSKTPIRHALDRLADHGLVEMQRNRYTRVAPIDLERVRNAVDLFGDIWIGSLRHAKAVIEADDLAHLTRSRTRWSRPPTCATWPASVSRSGPSRPGSPASKATLRAQLPSSVSTPRSADSLSTLVMPSMRRSSPRASKHFAWR